MLEGVREIILKNYIISGRPFCTVHKETVDEATVFRFLAKIIADTFELELLSPAGVVDGKDLEREPKPIDGNFMLQEKINGLMWNLPGEVLEDSGEETLGEEEA